jgi:hypothetical protein
MSAHAYLNKKDKLLCLVGGTAGIPNQSWFAVLPSSMTPLCTEYYADILLWNTAQSGMSIDLYYNRDTREIRSSHSINANASYNFMVLIAFK